MAFDGLPIVGPRGRLAVNGTNLNAGEWSVDPKADMVDVTSFEDVDPVTGATFQMNAQGKLSANFTFKLYFDASTGKHPHVNIGLTPGATLTSVKLFVDKLVAARCWTFPFAKVVGTPTVARVQGSNAIEVTVNAVSQGVFTAPQ
jgi:hypothetical protein